jgi:hypothetical protein
VPGRLSFCEVKVKLVTQDSQAKTLEAVLLNGDLSQLPPEQKVAHYIAVCESLGINHLTNPFAYIRLNGKEVLYAKRDCTDQLRKNHNISITISAREKIDDVFIVTARATTPDGRTDESVGAVPLGKASGENLSNLFMKAETKAKRRVTLSICGLGFVDESEKDSIPGAVEMVPLPAEDNVADIVKFIEESIPKLKTNQQANAKNQLERAGKDLEQLNKLKERVARAIS